MVVRPSSSSLGRSPPASWRFSRLLHVCHQQHDRHELRPEARPGFVNYGLAFAVILGLIGLRAFYEPGLTTYAIYPDRIEFEEGLLNRQRRTVLLDRIIDVQLIEGVLQRTAGAGSISLVTQQLVSQGDGRLSNRTFQLSNVPDPGGVYELIRSLALGGQGTKSVIPE